MEEARLWRSEMAANISVCRTLLELPMLHFPKFKNCCEALARVVPIFSSRLTVHHHRTTTSPDDVVEEKVGKRFFFNFFFFQE